jgi:hypothetical protein
MRTFDVILSKSYVVRISAEDKGKAEEYATFFTGDIQDISNSNERKELSFSIDEIDCRLSDVYDIEEINGFD